MMNQGELSMRSNRTTPLSRASVVILASLLALSFQPLWGSGRLHAQTGQVPTPQSVLGFRPGDDFKLATYEESIEYFQRLDQASDHLNLVEVGQNLRGPPLLHGPSLFSGEPGPGGPLSGNLLSIGPSGGAFRR